MNAEQGVLVYLYGFIPAGSPQPELAGVGDTPVELEEVGGLLAAVSRVPADSYSEQTLAERLRDVRWAAEQGALHERVVSWFVDRGGILPARLLTIYTSMESLRSAIAPRAATLLGEMRRFASLREWDLKVAFDEARLRQRLGEISQPVAALDAEIAGAEPGRRYLLEKKRAGLLQSEAAAAAARLAEDLLRRLSEYADEVKRLPLSGDGATLAARRAPGALPVISNAALLVASPSEPQLVAAARERADALGRLGIEVNFSGPWAPYRFVSAGDEGDADAAGA